MLSDRVNVCTELVSRVFESYSNSTEVFILGIPIYSSLNALIARIGIWCRSRGVWHRLSELNPNAT